MKEPPQGSTFQEKRLLPAVSLAGGAISLAVIAAMLQHLLPSSSVSFGWTLLLVVIIRLASAGAMLWLLERYAGRSRTWEVALYIFIIVLAGPDLARHALFGLGWDQMKVIGFTSAFAGAVYQLWEQVEDRGRFINLTRGICQCAGGMLLALFLKAENNWDILSVIVALSLIAMIALGIRNISKQFSAQY